MLNNLELEKKRIIQMAIEKKIISKKEYKEYEGKYIDQYGCDSFINYLSYLIVMGKGKNSIFLTVGNTILKDRDKIQKRFGLRIVTPSELNKEINHTLRNPRGMGRSFGSE
jgi:hypothetical protein